MNVEWTASSDSIEIRKTGTMSAQAHATGYPGEKPWIEAAFTVGDDRYSIRKDASDRYMFKEELCPPYLPPREVDFCWSNTMQIYDSNGNIVRDDSGKWPPLSGGIGVIDTIMGNTGIAEIETPGDISPCFPTIYNPTLPLDSAKIQLPIDSLWWGSEIVIVKPQSTSYPPGDLGGIVNIPMMTGPDYATVTVPTTKIGIGGYAEGDIICDVSDGYGHRYRIAYPLTVKRKYSSKSYSVSPNPAGERLDVKMTVEGDPAAVTVDAPVTALLYSGTGLVAKETFADIRNGGSLDVSHLTEGTYYLNIEVNGTVVDRQVMLIQR